jgi:chaperonin GroES
LGDTCLHGFAVLSESSKWLFSLPVHRRFVDLEERVMGTTVATRIRPLSDRVVIKALDESEQMRGGLYIPDTAKEKPSQGEVVAVGPGRISDDGKRLDMDVKVGDKVLYGKYSGTDVTLDGEEFLILRESDVLAVIK